MKIIYTNIEALKMPAKPANAAQKQWMNDIAEWSYDNLHLLYTIEFLNSNFQLHHVKGRAYKHNKVSIGHWFIIPVPFELHDVSSNHPLNVTHHKHAFTERFGRQSDLFNRMATMMDEQDYMTPDLEVCIAIKDTHA